MAYIINGTSFTNRKAITINNNSGSSLTDYQVPTTVTYAAAMKADYGDIRFAYPNGTNIAYWIEPRPAAEGGTVTISGNYRVHTFNSSGTFTTNKAMNAEYLVVAGGGSGGHTDASAVYGGAGGGGAGGFLTGTIGTTAQTYNVTVGSGGAASSGRGNTGNNSTFSTITSYGGSGGGVYSMPVSGGVGIIGSGGGGAGKSDGSTTAGGIGTPGQGYNGGNGGGTGTSNSPNYGAGGGGGAGSAGVNGSTTAGGNGGAGLASAISGTSTYYAGGGGGNTYNNLGTKGTGGVGGGGNASGTGNGSDATINSGGGGGAGYGPGFYSGSGGSGIVIIRYLLTEDYYVGSTANVWIKVNLPNVGTSPTGDNTVYMYYGNSSLTSESSTPNTFIREIPGVVGAWRLDEQTGLIADYSGNNNTGVSHSANLNDLSGNNNHGTKYSTNCDDLSGNGNHGTITDATRVAGKIGQALSFNGTTAYVSIPTFTIPTNVTFEAWINGSVFTASPTGNVIIGVSDASSVNSYIMFIYPSGSNRYIGMHEYTGAGNYRGWRGNTNLNTGTWYHVIVTQSSVGSTPIFYVNGLQETTTLYEGGGTMSGRNTQPLAIGRFGGSTQWYFNGLIDDVHIYNRSLSQAEITAHYNNGTGKILDPSTETGLKGYWRGDAVSDLPGKLGSALSFDGIDDSIDCGNNASLRPSGDMTIESWVYLTGGPSDTNYNIVNSESYTSTGFLVRINWGNWKIQYRTNYSGTFSDMTSLTSVTLNTWQHIVVVQSGTTGMIYINGILDKTASMTHAAAATIPLTISEGAQGWKGLIDDIRIYNRALSQAEITAHYNSGAGLISDPATETGLVGYWRMGPTDTMTVPGKFNNALKFDGIDDYVVISKNADPVGAISHAFWIKTSISQNNKFVFATSNGGTTVGDYIRVISDKLDWTVTNTSTRPFNALSTTNAINDGIWHYIVFTWDGTTSTNGAKVFVDGILNNQTTATTTRSGIPTYDISLGRMSDGTAGYNFGGLLDDYRIYNRALSQAEITDLYNNYGYTTTSYPSKELVKKYVATSPTVSMGTEETITAMSMSISTNDTPCRVGICTVTVNVTWTNTGGSALFTPSITIDGTKYSLADVTLQPGDTMIPFTISGLPVGTHAICPDPN